MKVFISYSRRDADFARSVYEYFQDSGHDVFTDTNNIQAGDVWTDTIGDNISKCDVFAVIITFASIRSKEVEKEVLQAQRENKIIIPCIHREIEKDDIKWNLDRFQGFEFDDKYDLARKLYSRIRTFQKTRHKDTTSKVVESSLNAYSEAKEKNPNQSKLKPNEESGLYDKAENVGTENFVRANVLDKDNEVNSDNNNNPTSRSIGAPIRLDNNRFGSSSMQSPFAQSNNLSLKVLEAYTRDVGRGVARIDYDSMDELGAYTGDVVEIKGKHKTVAKCLPLYPSDEGKGIITADGLVRNNAGIDIGDTVFVRKIKAVPAEKVIVAPLEAIPTIDERYLADALESVPLIKGDNVMVPYFGGRLTFQVIGVTPGPGVDAVLVTQKTVFQIAEGGETFRYVPL